MALNNGFRNNRLSGVRIKIIGVGGCGGNIVNALYRYLDGILAPGSFVVINTDKTELEKKEINRRHNAGFFDVNATDNDIVRVAIGQSGMGAGAIPEQGEMAAVDSSKDLKNLFGDDCDLIFLICGLGGGTGSGATHVIADLARESGKLVVVLAVKPFTFEGSMRKMNADAAQAKLEKSADVLFTIANQRLFEVSGNKAAFSDAFALVEKLILTFIKETECLLNKPSLMNVDFADLKTIIHGKGRGVFCFAEASGENAARKAAEGAVVNELLEHSAITGAESLLVYVIGDMSLKLDDVDTVFSVIRKEVGDKAKIIFGANVSKGGEKGDGDLLSQISTHEGGWVGVLILATGFSPEILARAPIYKHAKKDEKTELKTGLTGFFSKYLKSS